jgi:hypothetical protein
VTLKNCPQWYCSHWVSWIQPEHLDAYALLNMSSGLVVEDQADLHTPNLNKKISMAKVRKLMKALADGEHTEEVKGLVEDEESHLHNGKGRVTRKISARDDVCLMDGIRPASKRKKLL